MTEQTIGVLLVEDHVADARLLRESLRDASSLRFDWEHVSTLDAASSRIESSRFHVILLDLNLPDSFGLDTVRQVHRLAPHTAIIVLTGADDEDLATEAVRLGAQDYLIKGQVDSRLLARAVRYAMERQQILDELGALNETLEQRVAERTAVAERRARQLRALTAELNRAVECERRRIAGILHDGLQQLLVGAKFKLELLREPNDPAVIRSVEQVDALLDESIRISRSLSHELNPPELQGLDLAHALEWLAGWIQERHGLDVRVDADAVAEPEDENLRMLVFQTVRELLFNVVKHAGVDRVEVRLVRMEENSVRITITDHGKGFDPERAIEGFGLFAIRERLDQVEGRLEIDTAPGCGTRAIVTIPLDTADRGA